MIDQIESNDLSLTTAAKAFLKESAGWTKFISIVGFVFLGLLVLIALFAGAFLGEMMGNSGMGAMGGAVVTVIYLLIAALYFFPIYYLFQFSSKMKAALQTQNSEFLEQAFSNLKSHYKFMGILLIIALALYAIAFIFGGLAAMMV